VKDRTVDPHNLETGKDLATVLHAAGPAEELAGKLKTFGRFIGSWRIDWYGSATVQEPDAVDELHFG
jgi:hypothetical protein